MSGEIGVVLAAAGAGRRFGAKKQLLGLLGRPLLEYSLDAFAETELIASLVLVVSPEDLSAGREILYRWKEARRLRQPTRKEFETAVVAGGRRRQDSVLEGLRALWGRVEFAAVHDAARPLVRPREIAAVIEAARRCGAAVLGTPIADSVKRVRDGEIIESVPRDDLWTVQTPQVSRLEPLLRAYELGAEEDFTDETSALKAAGHRVAIVPGSSDNIKITVRADLELAERILRSRLEGAQSRGDPS